MNRQKLLKAIFLTILLASTVSLHAETIVAFMTKNWWGRRQIVVKSTEPTIIDFGTRGVRKVELITPGMTNDLRMGWNCNSQEWTIAVNSNATMVAKGGTYKTDDMDRIRLLYLQAFSGTESNVIVNAR